MPVGTRRSERQHDYLWSGGKRVDQIPDQDQAPDEEKKHQSDSDGDEADVNFVHSFGADPSNWEEALRSPYANEWVQASLEEKKSFEERGVF